MIRAGLIALALLAAPAAAQDRAATLADIRQELSVLTGQIDGLRRELSTTGSAMEGGAAASGPLERLDGLESELRRLTARTEELEIRIDRIVSEATNRIDDLLFRVTELEGGDVAAIPPTPRLGGEGPQPSDPMPPPVPELAVGEQADFDAAVTLSQEGTPADAYQAFDQFVQDYPRSPLAPEAHLLRGDMLDALGNTSQAGRAYLESYTLGERSDPRVASEALLKLGLTLAKLDQTREACITLGQVGETFPGTAAAGTAADRLLGFDCQ